MENSASMYAVGLIDSPIFAAILASSIISFPRIIREHELMLGAYSCCLSEFLYSLFHAILTLALADPLLMCSCGTFLDTICNLASAEVCMRDPPAAH